MFRITVRVSFMTASILVCMYDSWISTITKEIFLQDLFMISKNCNTSIVMSIVTLDIQTNALPPPPVRNKDFFLNLCFRNSLKYGHFIGTISIVIYVAGSYFIMFSVGKMEV